MEELKKEMESLFKGFKLKNIDGESSELKVYRQNLPAKAGQDDKDHFPHVTTTDPTYRGLKGTACPVRPRRSPSYNH